MYEYKCIYFVNSLITWQNHSHRRAGLPGENQSLVAFSHAETLVNNQLQRLKPLLHYAGNLLATWWQKMVAGDCHHIFTPIIFYWIKFVQCIFYIKDIVNKYLLTQLLPPVANGRQYVASKISASVKGALDRTAMRAGPSICKVWSIKLVILVVYLYVPSCL